MYLVYTPDGIVIATWILYHLSEVVVLKLTGAVYIWNAGCWTCALAPNSGPHLDQWGAGEISGDGDLI